MSGSESCAGQGFGFGEQGERPIELALVGDQLGQARVRPFVSRLQLQSPPQVPFGLVEPAGTVQHPSVGRMNLGRERVQACSQVDFRDRVGEPAHRHQQQRVDVAGIDAVWLELDRPLDRPLSRRPIPVEHALDVGQGRMGLAVPFVAGEGGESRFASRGRDVRQPQRAKNTAHPPRMCQRRVRRRIARIQGDGALEVRDGQHPVAFDDLPQQVPAEQVLLMRGRAATRNRPQARLLLRRGRRPDLGRDGVRHFDLQLRTSASRTLETAGPHVGICRGVDQLDRDPHSIVILPQAPLEDGIDVEFLRDCPDRQLTAGQAHGRRPRHYPHGVEPRQPRGDVLCQAGDDHILLRVTGEVLERQNQNRPDGWPRRPRVHASGADQRPDEQARDSQSGDGRGDPEAAPARAGSCRLSHRNRCGGKVRGGRPEELARRDRGHVAAARTRFPPVVELVPVGEH